MEDETKQRNKKRVISTLFSILFIGLLYGSAPQSAVDPLDDVVIGVDGVPNAFAYGGDHTLPQDTVSVTAPLETLPEEGSVGGGINVGQACLIIGAMACMFLGIQYLMK